MKDPIYRRYLLTMLLVILAFNNVDSLALGLMLQNIKADLGLTDTQLGFLSGIAFALFYSVMGIPIARWADRGNRATIIALTTALWSVLVAMSGLAANFAQLVLIRVGVAVGEAGCVPPANSLIADYFTPAERPRAVSIYLLGGPLSNVIGYFVAGWLNQLYGWRATFMMVGCPGLVLATAAWLTMREPRQSEPASGADRIDSSATIKTGAVPPAIAQPSARIVCVTLWRNRTFRHLLFSFSVLYFFGYGVVQWLPAFFVRSYGLQTGELGTWFAVINGAGGLVGTFAGGELASRLAGHNAPLQLKGTAIAYGSLGVVYALTYLAPNRYEAFVLMGVAAVGAAAATGPLFAMIQTLVPTRMRAVSIAIIYLFANLIGAGIGPLAAGALSDALRPWAGEESLRFALFAMCPGYLWCGWHLWRASRTVSEDLATVQSEEQLGEHACEA